MSSEKASKSPGLCPVKGQKASLGTQRRSRNQLLSLSLGVTKTSPPYPMLVSQPMSNPSSNILSRDSPRPAEVGQTVEQSRPLRAHRRSHYLVLQHVGDPIQPHTMLGRYIVQCLLALLDQWRLSEDWTQKEFHKVKSSCTRLYNFMYSVASIMLKFNW